MMGFIAIAIIIAAFIVESAILSSAHIIARGLKNGVKGMDEGVKVTFSSAGETWASKFGRKGE